ncbi:MAG: hypothetical protein A2086_16420 [Spirochaetes bacterium GWD1_27_9]|nr:MAG: hypothetical protein A2Z98_03110 [Spirochaetes bacterium GWB1_27_13]OHD27807.1 MAG: hypothetical protein A2Y34_16595 [Spirochaetes bacterium GWC1_27_15]OHD33017.1 MAG: hypothetical protein A2086_16420 [Spirochaetes bacterium GWD1_27_9]
MSINISTTYIDNKAEFGVKENIVHLSGIVDQRNPQEFLNIFFNRIKEEVSQEKLNEISFDITNLNFLNSSGLKALLNWIIALSKLKKEDKFKIVFLCSKEILWQKRSLMPLSLIAPDIVILKII